MFEYFLQDVLKVPRKSPPFSLFESIFFDMLCFISLILLFYFFASP
jgi:hypothetical protein